MINATNGYKGISCGHEEKKKTKRRYFVDELQPLYTNNVR